jgi:hypothetical protein
VSTEKLMEEVKLGGAANKALKIANDVIDMIKIGDIGAEVIALRSLKEVRAPEYNRCFVIELFVGNDRSRTSNMVIGITLEQFGATGRWTLAEGSVIGLSAVTFGPPAGRSEISIQLPHWKGKVVLDQYRQEFLKLTEQVLC